MNDDEIMNYFLKEFPKWIKYVSHETGESEEFVIDRFLSQIAEDLVNDKR